AEDGIRDRNVTGVRRVLFRSQKQIYFNFPLLKVVHYGYSWIFPLLIIAWLFFVGILIMGFRKRQLNWKSLGRGGLAFALCLIIGGLSGYFGWQLIMKLYPRYAEIQQGFPYNGHAYIIAFVAFALFVFFAICHRFSKSASAENLMV